jgi:hypothetical protein
MTESVDALGLLILLLLFSRVSARPRRWSPPRERGGFRANSANVPPLLRLPKPPPSARSRAPGSRP